MPSNYLASFRPLCATVHGRTAIKAHGLPRFIDGSCRREPDLEHEWPSISALCRASKLVPRLEVGDRVAFVTVRGRYDVGRPACWKLVALLRVEQRFGSHGEAAAWYSKRGLRLPSNCMVPANEPVPLERTKGPPRDLPRSDRQRSPERMVQLWDARYRSRAQEWPIMLACEKLIVELHEPARIEEEDWLRWNGYVPGTQNPPKIDDRLWDRLAATARRAA